MAGVRSSRRIQRRLAPAWAAGIAAVLVTAVGIGLAVVRFTPADIPEPTEPATASPTASAQPTSGPVGDFPLEVLGLPVISVSEAIARREAGPEGTELAVRGWTSTAPPMSCPAQLEPLTPLELRCPERFTSWLTERREPTWERLPSGMRGIPPSGPAIQPLIRLEVPREPLDGIDAEPHGPEPFPVVLVGHFNDHRSLLCPDIESCRRHFVVDTRVWVAGRPAGRETVVVADGAVARLTPEQAGQIAKGKGGAPMGPPWIALLPGTAIDEVDPRFENPPALLWVVREMANDSGRPVARTFFVDDATGDLYTSKAGGILRITVIID